MFADICAGPGGFTECKPFALLLINTSLFPLVYYFCDLFPVFLLLLCTCTCSPRRDFAEEANVFLCSLFIRLLLFLFLFYHFLIILLFARKMLLLFFFYLFFFFFFLFCCFLFFFFLFFSSFRILFSFFSFVTHYLACTTRRHVAEERIRARLGLHASGAERFSAEQISLRGAHRQLHSFLWCGWNRKYLP